MLIFPTTAIACQNLHYIYPVIFLNLLYHPRKKNLEKFAFERQLLEKNALFAFKRVLFYFKLAETHRFYSQRVFSA